MDRARVRNLLLREEVYASALSGFLSTAFNRGREIRISIRVDGEDCGVGILTSGKDPLIEYMANWAISEKLVKRERLDEFDKGQVEYERERVRCLEETKKLQQANALGADSGIRAGKGIFDDPRI